MSACITLEQYITVPILVIRNVSSVQQRGSQIVCYNSFWSTIELCSTHAN